MAGHRVAWAVVLTWGILHACGEESAAESAAKEDDSEADAMQPQQNATPAERDKMMVTCKHVVWRKWSMGQMEEIGELVNETIDKAGDKAVVDADGNESNASEPKLNYSEATRALATAQLASCARSVTLADVEADAGGSLSETAVERLLGGAAIGFNLTAEEHEVMDSAFKNRMADDGYGPALLGIQVHRVPWWLQIIYMLGVVGALCYVVMTAVGKLTERDREKSERAESSSAKKELKEAKAEGKKNEVKKLR